MVHCKMRTFRKKNYNYYFYSLKTTKISFFKKCAPRLSNQFIFIEETNM